MMSMLIRSSTDEFFLVSSVREKRWKICISSHANLARGLEAESVLPVQTKTPRDRHVRRRLAQNDVRAQTPLLRPTHPHQEERAAGTDAGAGSDISVHGSSLPLLVAGEEDRDGR
jgi:hypothetical protein